jgi:N-acetylglutamate synthase-like GNAT family acetyltransferase
MQRSSVDSVLRSTQAYCQQLCEKQTLDYGIAYYSVPFADLPEANQFREVWIENPSAIPKAFAEAEAWFADQGLFCYRWVPANGQTSSALSEFLAEHAFCPRVMTVMTLTRWVDAGPVEGVRVLPARAMRAGFREAIRLTHNELVNGPTDLAIEALEERLDDPPFDMFVAIVEGQPAGLCALHQVGDIARVTDLQVAPAFVQHEVDRALLGHVLTLAKRLAMRNIYVACHQPETPATTGRGRSFTLLQPWLESMGFSADGEITEFIRQRPV